MKRHIAFVTTGDIEDIATSKRAFGMAEPLNALGYRVSILLEDTPANRHRHALEAPSANILWFARQSAREEARTKRRMLREIDPDLVYVGSYGIRNMVSPVRPTRAMYVVEHSELPSAIETRPMSRRVLDYWLERLALRSFDAQICASRFLVDFIREKLPKSQWHLVHYSPYAHTRRILLPDGPRPLKQTRSGRKRLLYMGTLAPNYGIFHILDAVARLRGTLDLELVVLGKGRAFKEAVAYAKNWGLEDIVDFKGYVPEDDLPKHLADADAFVAPIFDTVQDLARCPSKMFMYVAYNRPIVTSRIGEAAELFGPNYEFYFNPDHADDMAEKISCALTAKDWAPSWNAADHEWEARSRNFDSWLREIPGSFAKRDN